MLDTTAASQQFQRTGRHEYTPGDWPIDTDFALALRALQKAAQHGRHLAHPLIASIVQPVPWRDPLAIYSAAQSLTSADVYWEQPAQRSAFVGIGAAATITTDGDDQQALHSASSTTTTPIQLTISRWRELLADAQIVSTPHCGDLSLASSGGPLCFGGFAFDPLAPHSTLWDGFPAGLLTLPRLLFSVVGAQTLLTRNFVLAGNEDQAALERLIERQALLLMRLRGVVERAECADELAAGLPGRAQFTELQAAGEWQARVAQAALAIRRGAYTKVVLARGVQADAEQPFDLPAALARLRAVYPSATIFAFRRGTQTFLGATPERLARVGGGRLETMALAGTAPRGPTEDADVALGHELLASAKNRQEHAIVAATVRAALTPLVDDPQAVQIASEPQLLRLPNVQHLITPISAALRSGVGALEVAAALHPTPAVGGYPRAAALAAIRACERLDRGWYAGPVGWVGAAGEGEFVVALRSALVHGAKATLFAGCGIVADSDPQAEYAESQLKLAVMLRGLGLDVAQSDTYPHTQPHTQPGADRKQPHDA